MYNRCSYMLFLPDNSLFVPISQSIFILCRKINKDYTHMIKLTQIHCHFTLNQLNDQCFSPLCRGCCMCKATGQKQRRWWCDMQYNVPVNNTYINICTIKSILVNNTAEDANTNKQTNKVKQKHPD